MTDGKKLSILAIGDCNTGGTRDHGTHFNVPKQLTEKLELAGRQCELHNYGTTMSTCREGIAMSAAHSQAADWLLLNFGLVDAWITSIPQVYISYYPDNKLKKIARKLLKSLKKRLRKPAQKGWVRSGHVIEAEEYSQNLQRIIDTQRQKNPNLRVLLWGSAPTDNTERNQYLKQYDGYLRDLKQDQDLFFDTAELINAQLCAEPAINREALYDDSVHLSAKGAGLIADKLKDLIIDSQAQNSPSPSPATISSR